MSYKHTLSWDHMRLSIVVLVVFVCSLCEGVPIQSIVSSTKNRSVCFATRVLDGWAITTTKCAQQITQGSVLRGAVADRSREPVALGGNLTAIPVDSSMNRARIEPADFTKSGWTQGTVGPNVPVSPSDLFSVPVFENGLVGVAPAWPANCSIVEGAPLFVDDIPTGAPSWLDVPIVGVVVASASSCTTLAVQPLVPSLAGLLALATGPAPPPSAEEPQTVWVWVPRAYEDVDIEDTWFIWFIFVLIIVTLLACSCTSCCDSQPPEEEDTGAYIPPRFRKLSI